MPKVSVIIPIYHVEIHIERCARSLFEQTLNDIEYIFVDDCTIDKSMEILEFVIKDYELKLQRENKLVRTAKMPANSGQAAVRWHGIQLATGDYIIHCDSDDWIDTDLYEKMYAEAIRSGADIIKCPIRDEYKYYGSTRSYHKLPNTCYEIVQNWWKHSEGMFCWNKMVKRTIYTENDIKPFEGINMWEDNGLMLRTFYYAKGFSQIKGSVYHYNQSNSSAITGGYNRDKIDQMIRCASLLEEFFESKSDSTKFYKTVLTLKFLAKLNLITNRYDWLKEFYSLYPESDIAASWINLDAFSLKGKIRFILVKYHLERLFILFYKAINSISALSIFSSK